MVGTSVLDAALVDHVCEHRAADFGPVELGAVVDVDIDIDIDIEMP